MAKGKGKKPTKEQKSTPIYEGNQSIHEIWERALISGVDEDLFRQITEQNLETHILTLYINLKSMQEKHEDEYTALTNDTLASLELIRELLINKKTYDFDDVIFVIDKFNSGETTLEKKKIRELRSNDIGKMIMFDGLVKNSTGVVSKMQLVAMQCTECQAINFVLQEGDVEDVSTVKCMSGCTGSGHELVRDEDRSIFVNFMKCDIEEDPEGLRGKQPERISCEFLGPLTDEGKRIGVGDRVTVIGIYRVREKTKGSLIYEGYVEVMGVVRRGKTFEELSITEEEEKKFTEMSKDPNLLEKMALAIAPNISGYHVVKQALLLQMFGGNPEAGDRRGDMHILIIGDPGIAKSKIASNISDTAPQVVKASGAPTTTVGLTACVIKDETAPGGFILEAGAAVLADGGLLVVDEFDKMNKEARGAMHEILEDQRVTISKANINTTLNARCSVLAIMNPKRNRFNNEEVVSDQIDLPPSLLSRFDLIFAIKDEVDRKTDGEVYDAIARARNNEIPKTEYSQSDITKYILYAKSKIKKVTIGPEIHDYLRPKYQDIRASNKDGSISITPRQADGILRLTEACAKMRLSETASIEDANKAMKIVVYYLDTMCMDPATKQYSVDMGIGTEAPSQKTARLALIPFIESNWDELVTDTGYIPIETLKNTFMKETNSTETAFTKAFNEAKDNGLLVFKLSDQYVQYLPKKKLSRSDLSEYEEQREEPVRRDERDL